MFSPMSVYLSVCLFTEGYPCDLSKVVYFGIPFPPPAPFLSHPSYLFKLVHYVAHTPISRQEVGLQVKGILVELALVILFFTDSGPMTKKFFL